MSRLTKRLLFPLEAAGALAAYGLLRSLPIEVASRFSAWVLGLVGPRLSLHRVARQNLEAALPDTASDEIDRILRGMWRNLGRSAGEFAHIRTLVREMDARVEIVDPHNATVAMATGGPAIYVSGHLANWELMPLAAAHLGLVLDLVYRAPDNPLIASLYDKRRPHPDSRLLPKGSTGGRMALATLKAKRPLGILVDQKMNEGIEARFFGRKAMTTPAFAQFARRFDCPIVPIRIERIGDAVRFRITATEPIRVPKTENAAGDVAAVVQQVNDLLEGWIRDRPEQWLWVHRRWPKD